MDKTKAQVFHTCAFVRLSREDGDKKESNSVTGQKDLIRDYMTRHGDLRERGMKVDDGFTGSYFDRPGVQALLKAALCGEVQCIYFPLRQGLHHGGKLHHPRVSVQGPALYRSQ